MQNRQPNLLAEALAALMRDVDAMQQLYRIAERDGCLPRDSLQARELVTDVVEDLLLEEATYSPERPLTPQIERHVRRRANRLRKANRPRSRRGALQPEFLSLDDAQDVLMDDAHGTPDTAEVAMRIRELARDDEAAQQLLALYDRDLVLRRDALAAGMTDWAYRAARERLAGYAALAVTTAAMAEAMAGHRASAGAAPTTLAIGLAGRPPRVHRAVPHTFDHARASQTA